MADDDEVGYGKPPKRGQFKKGQSGNPKGRPKGAKNLKTDLLEELQEKILIKEGGTAKSISKQRAALKTLIARALKGDSKALATFLNLVLKVIADEDEAPNEPELTATDQEILAQFAKKVLGADSEKKGQTDDD